jgi:hypothetical protein
LVVVVVRETAGGRREVVGVAVTIVWIVLQHTIDRGEPLLRALYRTVVLRLTLMVVVVRETVGRRREVVEVAVTRK